jgi:hypothetical protein
MFTKNKVTKSMIDAVNQVIIEKNEDELLNEAGAPIKQATPTGMRVFGRSYGNSAKAKQDQTKSAVDTLKGPKDKEMKEAAKPDFLDMDKDGDKKEPMKKAVADKKKVSEELKGDQHKIDANKNNKVDAHDFAILRGKKKVKEDMEFAKKLMEVVKRSDIPAYLRKARGDAPLTPAEVKSGPKDSISHKDNLAKARNEEVESLDEKNVPTSPEKWAKAKSAAKSKFAVYPSAYANGWASKKYKAMGGGWKTESVEHDVEVELEEGIFTDDESIAKHLVKKYGKNVKSHDIKLAIHMHPEPHKTSLERVAGHVSKMLGGKPMAEELSERTMTDDEMKERERIVKGMKKGLAGFKARYGDDAKSVMYATANKQAMKEGLEDRPPLTTDTLAGRLPGGKANSFKSYKVRLKPLDKEEDDSSIPELDVPEKTKAETTIKVEATIAGLSGWKKVKKDVEDKSGAVHTPMSRARDLAQKAFKKVQDKTKVKN